MPETLDEIITSYREKLNLDSEDGNLIFAINQAIEDSKNLKNEMDKIGKRNKLYWKKGTEVDLDRIHPKKSKAVANRIFVDIETAIPIITSETPEASVIGNYDNALKEKLYQALSIAFEVKYKMQQKLQALIRNWFLFRVGVLKYRWDINKRFITENVLPKKIGFDNRATSRENCEFVFEQLEDNLNNIIDKFPKAKQKIIDKFGKEKLKSKVKYIEFWGGYGEWVCWKFQDIILDKRKNPNWDYDNEDNNIFDKPEIPYLFFNVFNLGDETGLYDDNSLIEQAIPLQEQANKLEQQIADLNEGQKRVWVLSLSIPANIRQELINKTGDLAVTSDNPSQVVQVQSGKPDASLFNHLSHILGEIDNTIGIHSTTRGERSQQETLGGRQLLMGSDYGRLDLIVRNVEQIIEEWYLAYLHCLKVYSDGSEILSNQQLTIELRKEEIPNNVIVMVKKGSTLPVDKRTKMQQAIQLAQFNMIDPATLFQELGISNEDKRTKDLYAWLQLTGKIVPQQPPMPQGSQSDALQGQEGQQLQKLQQLLSSPQFQQLPSEEQQALVQRGRGIVENIKNQK